MLLLFRGKQVIPPAPPSTITVRKNSGADIGTRPRLNFIEGLGIVLTILDDGINNEIDILIDAFTQAHQSTHQSGGSDALVGLLDAIARVTIRKNTGADVGSRRRLNLIEGANITITAADDPVSEEVDITIAAGAGSFAATRVVATAAFPAKRTQVINVVDAAVTALSKVLAWVAGIADGQPDGGDLIDLETMHAVAKAGSFDLEMTFHTPWAGSLTIDYVIG